MLFGRGEKYRLFSIFGFPVFIQSSILILLLIYLVLGSSGGPRGIIQALIFVVVAFASILVHELGHALMVRRLRYGESTILLHGLGGLTQWRGTPSRRHRILISLAGPGAGIMVGLVTLLLVLVFGFPRQFLLGSIVLGLLWINLGWSVINLLPVWPLDGGHVLRASLESPRRSQTETTQTSLKVSMITAGGMIVLCLMINLIFAAILFGLLLWTNYNEWKRLQGPPASFYGY